MYDEISNIASMLNRKLFSDRGLSLPRIGVVLGSGLGGLVEQMEDIESVEYGVIEGFACSTVEGHSGRFVGGSISGVSMVAMQGRVHYYEGYDMSDVVKGVRTMALMGVGVIIVTNAAGGVNDTYDVGDIMLITDHINLLPNPLIGVNDSRFGVRFPDMTQPYSGALMDIARDCGGRLGVELQEGVYLGSSGPSYETPAEYEYFARIGADACGMSTTPEVIAARHMGVEVLGFSVITNIGRGKKATEINSHQDVVEASNRASHSLEQIVRETIIEIANRG